MARQIMLKIDPLSALLTKILRKAGIGILSEIRTDADPATGLPEFDPHFLESQGLRYLLGHLRCSKNHSDFARATLEAVRLPPLSWIA